jgi:hypothetical protein
MGTYNGSSWITFNRVLKGDKKSLEKWLDKVDKSVLADHILTLNDSKETKIPQALSRKISNIKSIIKNKNLSINVISSSAKEYKTRVRSWTFNFVELHTYDYTLFIGYNSDNKSVTYWLIKSFDLEIVSPASRSAQSINGRVSFPVWITTKETSPVWKKFEKHILSEDTLFDMLNKL